MLAEESSLQTLQHEGLFFEVNLEALVTYRIGIPSELHTSQLHPRPLCVKLSGSNKCEVNS